MPRQYTRIVIERIIHSLKLILAEFQRIYLKVKYLKIPISIFFIFTAISGVCFVGGCGHGGFSGYNNSWLHRQGISTIYVEMFDSQSFRRGHEYDLTDAICKRIETDTPYKIVSDRNVADSILSGKTTSSSRRKFSVERNTGRIFENQANVTVTVRWQNLKTSEIMIDNESVNTFVGYSAFVGQDFEYSSKVALNRAAERIVELMQSDWQE